MRPYPLALRQATIAQLATGASPHQLADELGLSVSTLRRWARRWRQTGEVAPRAPPGAPRRLTPELVAALTAELRTHPTMTLTEMRDWLHTSHAITVSTATIDRALHRLGWRFRPLR